MVPVDGAEMSLDPAEFFLENRAEEPGIKLANLGRGHSDVHGFLSTTKHHVIVDGRDGSRVDRTLRLVRV